MGGEWGGERSWGVGLVEPEGVLGRGEMAATHDALGTHLNGRALAGTRTIHNRDGCLSIGPNYPGIQ